jgi:hypothetical protein
VLGLTWDAVDVDAAELVIDHPVQRVRRALPSGDQDRDFGCFAIMRVLRHADLSVTMEIYAKASSAATTDALRRLGDSLE